MPPDSPSQPSPVPRPRRRWLRRVLMGVGLLVLVLAIFYRPLGHWAIGHFGGGALEKAGLSGEWKTSGTLFTGLSVDALKLTGNDTAQVRSVTMRHAELDYDLMALRGGGPGTVLKKLVVQDLDMEIDLTRPGPPKSSKKPAGPKTKPKLPNVILPEIRIEHVSLRMTMPGDVLVVRDFSLILDPAKPGIIEAEILDLPGAPAFQNIKSVTRVEPQRLILERTVLGPDLEIENLVMDLADLARDEAAIALQARQGPARVSLTGKSGAWFSSPTADMKLETTGLTHETLAFWGVPAGGVAWRAGKLDLAAKGPVLRPDLLETTLILTDGGTVVKDVRIDPVSLQAVMSGGTFTLTDLHAAQGSSLASAKARAALPQTWAEIAKVPGSLDFVLKVPQLAEVVPASAEVTGQADVQGQVGFSNARLTAAKANLKAASLRIRGVPVESADAEVRLADQIVHLEKALVRLNAENTLTASGELGLDAPRRFAAVWDLEAPDLSTVPAEAQAGPLWPGAGRVVSQGKAVGNLTELLENVWTSLQAQATVDVTGLKLKEAVLESLQLQAGAVAGKVQIESMAVRLDPDNRLDASGSFDLTGESLPMAASVLLKLPDISKASVWSTSFGGPALRGGKAEVVWDGQGRLKPLSLDSTGSVLVQSLKMDGVPEVLGLSAEVTQSGSEIHVPTLKASAGPWRAEGSAQWDGWHLTIPKLEAFAKEQKLVDLTARVPWHGGAVPPDSPVSLKLKVDSLDASKLAAALGKPLPVTGILNADGNFEGTLRTLSGSLTAEADQLRPAAKTNGGPKLDAASLKLDARVAGGRLTLDGVATQRPLQPMTLTASLPMDLMGLMSDPKQASSLPLRAQVKLPSSSLAFLPTWVPALRSIQGTASADFSVTGTVGQPVWEGGASVLASEALFTSSALPTVKDLKVKARMDEKRLRLDEATVVLAGGRLKVEGGAGLETPADPTLDLKLTASEVLVIRDENLSLRANAAINCQGKLSKAAVRGQIDLVRGRVFKEIEFLPLSLPNDLPPPPPSTTLGKSGPPALPAPLDQWDFNVAIKTGDPIRLLGNVARGNAVVDLKLAGLGAKPELTGAVRLEEMWLKLPFSRLTITDGAITFNREQPFDPQIDITGESITGSRIVQVFVQGRALDPKVRLTSSPPLPEGEIASLLATGVTTSDLTSSGDEAAGRAAFVLLKQTYRKLFRKSAVDGDDDEPPRLSFDFSVFGSDPARRGVSAIYELNPHWRLIGRVGETGTFRGLLHYLIRFR